MKFFLIASTILLALVGGSLADNGVCPTNIPSVQVTIPQSYDGDVKDYDWTISLTQPVNDPPAGDQACTSPAYISQYTPKGGCEASPSTQNGAPYPIANGCLFSFKDSIRTMSVTVTCDPNAAALTMGSPVTVTQGANNAFQYSFTATYSGVCGGGGGDDNKSPACGGGCAFTIIFFVGGAVYVAGTVAWNYFKAGKRGKELAPHPEFWLMVPGLIKDGAVFAFRTATSPCRKDGGGGGSSYAQV